MPVWMRRIWRKYLRCIKSTRCALRHGSDSNGCFFAAQTKNMINSRLEMSLVDMSELAQELGLESEQE